MATLTTRVVPHAGLVLDRAQASDYPAASAGGDACQTGAGVVLHVLNGDAASKTVTLNIPSATKIDGDLTINNRAVVIAAGKDAIIPVPDLFADPTTGLASITYSAVTSVKVAALRIPSS